MRAKALTLPQARIPAFEPDIPPPLLPELDEAGEVLDDWGVVVVDGVGELAVGTVAVGITVGLVELLKNTVGGTEAEDEVEGTGLLLLPPPPELPPPPVAQLAAPAESR